MPISSDVTDSIYNKVLASEYNNLRTDMLVMYPELTNKSGGGLVAGDVVIVDIANDESFTTTTSEDEDLVLGVLFEDIADNALGLLCPLGVMVNVSVWGVVTRGNFLACGTVAGRGVDIGGSLTLGTYAVAMEAHAGAGAGTILARIMLGKTARHDSLYGMVVYADATCPADWARFTALDGKYPKGAASYGGTGGAATHTHDYTDLPEHTHAHSGMAIGDSGTHDHTVSDSITLNSGGSHNHTYTRYLLTTTKGQMGAGLSAWQSTSSQDTSSSGAHQHGLTGSVSAAGTHSHNANIVIDNAGTAGTLVTDSQNGEPPYLEMIYCEKTTHDEL